MIDLIKTKISIIGSPGRSENKDIYHIMDSNAYHTFNADLRCLSESINYQLMHCFIDEFKTLIKTQKFISNDLIDQDTYRRSETHYLGESIGIILNKMAPCTMKIKISGEQAIEHKDKLESYLRTLSYHNIYSDLGGDEVHPVLAITYYRTI
ncbi:hypothetical protein C5S42_00650 [Candidatus Methanomarinus sp.]|nr:hypothetical protein C5S42_00650 [ANME-2 cluster archaeon]